MTRSSRKNRDEECFSATIKAHSLASDVRMKNSAVIEVVIEGFRDGYSTCDKRELFSLTPKRDVIGIECEVDWEDQGWGNRKGGLQIRGYVGELFNEPAPHGREVWFSSFPLQAPAGKPLDYTFRTGGGGGHTLALHRLVVRVFTNEIYRCLATFRAVRDAPQDKANQQKPDTPVAAEEHETEPGAGVTDAVIKQLFAAAAQLPWDVVRRIAMYVAYDLPDTTSPHNRAPIALLTPPKSAASGPSLLQRAA